MNKFQIHDENTAPETSRETLTQIKAAFGFIPNAMGMLAESKPVLGSYLAMDAAVKETSLTAEEIQILILSVSHENDCHYCMAAHTMQAKIAGVDAEEIESLREGGRLAETKHQALAEFGRKMVRQRGWIGKDELQTFFDAGYTKANVFDVILVVAMKTITNYANHITDVPLDDAFSDYQWEADSPQAERA